MVLDEVQPSSFFVYPTVSPPGSSVKFQTMVTGTALVKIDMSQRKQRTRVWGKDLSGGGGDGAEGDKRGRELRAIAIHYIHP